MKYNILIVDDFDDARLMLKSLLAHHGYEVTEAADGLEAVEIVKKSAPDLILMDFAMPRMNGIEAARNIRRLSAAAKTPILCVTAYGKRILEEATDAQFDDVIAKPVDVEALPSIIRRHLGEGAFGTDRVDH